MKNKELGACVKRCGKMERIKGRGAMLLECVRKTKLAAASLPFVFNVPRAV